MGIKVRRSTVALRASFAAIAAVALTIGVMTSADFARAADSSDDIIIAQAGEFADTDRAFEINPDAADEVDGASGLGQPSEDGTPGSSQAMPENARPDAAPPGCTMREGPLELLV